MFVVLLLKIRRPSTSTRAGTPLPDTTRYRTFHPAPAMLAKRNAKGELVKKEYGPWVFTAFGLLARLRGLRGGSLDVFGYTTERRMERRLIDDYERTVG